MPELCFVGCSHFHGEVAAAVATEGWEGVQAVAVPARCGRPPLRWDEIATALPPGCNQVVLMGRACLAGLADETGRITPPAGLPPVQVQRLAQCFHLVAGPQQVAQAIAAGGHLVTPGWLAHWRKHLADMGLPADMAAGFFHEHAREVVLLDTGVNAQAADDLADFAAAVALPTRRLAVGLDSLRPLLAQWRAQALCDAAQAQLQQVQATATAQAQQHRQELADQACGIDLLRRLTQVQHEAEAVEAITELLGMLFAPRAVAYLRVEGEATTPVGEADTALLAELQALQQDLAFTADGQGFMLRLAGKEMVGKLAVHGLAFPEHRQRYANLALALAGPCALAIEGTRLRRRLLQAEKMASLGVLVAGVAHEINTPLGVDLMAVSSLQMQTRTLAGRFAAHSMTQADLQRYLRQAEDETTLIRANLERMGALVDAFRAVAVGGQAPRKTRFGLRECLDDVLRSLGARLPRDRVQVGIDCDPALQVHSHRADWASIFGNLVTNSLKHGFVPQGAGRIHIAAAVHGDMLHLDYRDDGQGMAAQTLARLFDPFFTTDPAQGMGLGMHLVFNLVSQRLDGSIRCHSAPGQGVHMHIETPL